MKQSTTKLSVVALAATFGFPGVSAAAGDTIVYEIVSGWTIRTDLNQNYACYAETLFEGDSIIRVGFDATKSVFVTVGDPSWSAIEPGETYSVELDFGDDAPWASSGSGVALDTETAQPGLHVEIDSADGRRFIDAFMKQLVVDVSFEDREALSLSLAGSYRAGAKLDECQAAMAELRRPTHSEPAEPLQAAQ
jgi:hypothetical protein